MLRQLGIDPSTEKYTGLRRFWTTPEADIASKNHQLRKMFEGFEQQSTHYRTPFGRLGGGLKDYEAPQLGAHVHRPRQHEAGKEGGGIEPDHRDAGHGAIEDEHDAGRDEDAECPRSADHPGRETRLVAEPAHLSDRDAAHRCNRGDARAADRREPSAGSERRDGNPARDAVGMPPDPGERLLCNAGLPRECAHEDEHGDDEEGVALGCGERHVCQRAARGFRKVSGWRWRMKRRKDVE
jgi:hypothetical protein